MNITEKILARASSKERVRPGEVVDAEIDSAMVHDGVIIVAGENFGQGSRRKHAPIALKASGVKCVVAQSFARIFYRNAISIGLPALECPGILREVRDGDELLVELEQGEIRNVTTGATLRTQPIPDGLLQVLNAGGIIEYLKRKRSQR